MGMWTGKELMTLHTLWSTATTEELLAALPERSLSAIQGRAGQLHLGARDRSLGKVDGKDGALGLDGKINVGVADLLLMRLRQHHSIGDVKEFSL